MEPAFAVIWTVKFPVVVKVHDNVALPGPVRLAGMIVHDVLLVVRLIVPEKPFIPVIVIVDVPVALTFTLMFVGLVVIVKS